MPGDTTISAVNRELPCSDATIGNVPKTSPPSRPDATSCVARSSVLVPTTPPPSITTLGRSLEPKPSNSAETRIGFPETTTASPGWTSRIRTRRGGSKSENGNHNRATETAVLLGDKITYVATTNRTAAATTHRHIGIVAADNISWAGKWRLKSPRRLRSMRPPSRSVTASDCSAT